MMPAQKRIKWSSRGFTHGSLLEVSEAKERPDSENLEGAIERTHCLTYLREQEIKL
jgi:hypothetical protein